MALFNIKGNDVNHVLVSPATRAMSLNAKTPEQKRDALESERREIIARINEADVELSSLNAQIRGQKLPEDIFKSLTSQQVALKRLKQSAMKRLAEITSLVKDSNRGLSSLQTDLLLMVVKEQRETNRLLSLLVSGLSRK